MLESLITSKTRIKLLLKFFSNSETHAYLRGLAEEMGASTNAVRVELNRLTKAGLLETSNDGRTKLYQANTKHTLFPELHSLVKKYLGIEQLVDNVLTQIGSLKMAFITGDYAKGIDSGIIDLVIVGEIERGFLQHLLDKAEEMIKRKIRVLVLTQEDLIRLKDRLNIEKALVIWNNSIDVT
ncbi:MAG: winged helix-turn-helix domain-containing protein [Nitrospirota bacterium]